MNEEMSVMPFTADSKNPLKERIFKQVSFPGSEGVYRLRVISAEGETKSAVTQKYVDTGIPANNVDGAIFRIKAVLDTPQDEVSESYWLTLGNGPQPGEIRRLNQYRIRGISDVGYRSDWVYSDLKDDQNELLVYEMLYDLLDIMTMVREGEIESLISLITEDALQATLRKDRIRYDHLIDQAEEATMAGEEQIEIGKGGTSEVNEQVTAVLTELFQMIGKELGHEFKESFMSSQKEFSEIMKLYRVADNYRNRTTDMMTMILEVFLEDSLDRIVKKSTIEVFVENGENQAIYLDGTIDFDIKSEILKASYDLMPQDDFVIATSSAVQLLLEPALQEQVDYVHLESTKTELRYFKTEVLEALVAEPAEELLMLLRLFVQDAIFPYLAIDQMQSIVQHNLHDGSDLNKSRPAGIVQYDLYEDDNVTQYIIVKDIIKELIGGDLLPHIDDYFVTLLDKLIYRVQEKAHIIVDYEMTDVFSYFAGMGERIHSGYTAIKTAYSEEWAVGMADAVEARQAPLLSAVDVMGVSLNESHAMTENLFNRVAESMDALFGESIASSAGLSAEISEQTHMSIGFTHQIIANYQHRLLEYYNVLIHDDTKIRADIDGKMDEVVSLNPTVGFYPVYMPNISDQSKILPRDLKTQNILPELSDRLTISGKEKVQYALGNDFDQGWPLGEFVLGVNTLKGVDS